MHWWKKHKSISLPNVLIKMAANKYQQKQIWFGDGFIISILKILTHQSDKYNYQMDHNIFQFLRLYLQIQHIEIIYYITLDYNNYIITSNYEFVYMFFRFVLTFFWCIRSIVLCFNFNINPPKSSRIIIVINVFLSNTIRNVTRTVIIVSIMAKVQITIFINIITILIIVEQTSLSKFLY